MILKNLENTLLSSVTQHRKSSFPSQFSIYQVKNDVTTACYIPSLIKHTIFLALCFWIFLILDGALSGNYIIGIFEGGALGKEVH